MAGELYAPPRSRNREEDVNERDLEAQLRKVVAVFVSVGGFPKIKTDIPYILLTEKQRDEICDQLASVVPHPAMGDAELWESGFEHLATLIAQASGGLGEIVTESNFAQHEPRAMSTRTVNASADKIIHALSEASERIAAMRRISSPSPAPGDAMRMRDAAAFAKVVEFYRAKIDDRMLAGCIGRVIEEYEAPPTTDGGA